MHKLPPPWEGPFFVSQVLHNDVYRLIENGKETERTWNIAQLFPFFAYALYLSILFQVKIIGIKTDPLGYRSGAASFTLKNRVFTFLMI